MNGGVLMMGLTPADTDWVLSASQHLLGELQDLQLTLTKTLRGTNNYQPHATDKEAQRGLLLGQSSHG